MASRHQRIKYQTLCMAEGLVKSQTDKHISKTYRRHLNTVQKRLISIADDVPQLELEEFQQVRKEQKKYVSSLPDSLDQRTITSLLLAIVERIIESSPKKLPKWEGLHRSLFAAHKYGDRNLDKTECYSRATVQAIRWWKFHGDYLAY